MRTNPSPNPQREALNESQKKANEKQPAHPAYLLRSPDRKRDVWEDMKKVRAVLTGEA